MPSRKWWAARVTALAGLAVLVATNGWHIGATVMAITIASSAATSWLTPNADPVPGPAVLEGGRRRR